MSRRHRLLIRGRSIVAASLTVATLTWALPAVCDAFCGFYVAGADAKLFNNATVVVLLRDGKRTVLSMQNNCQGPPEDFALVIPVPVVLQETDVKVLRPELFDRVETLASPRLVEYWERDPCADPGEEMIGLNRLVGRGSGGSSSAGILGVHSVVIEAEFAVGEYDIVILSATESNGLESWLRDNDYSLPEGAEPLLRPYVAQGMKFFVAKVDPKKVKFDEDGRALLSPLRFHYDSDEFSLPVRLGLINAPDPARGGRQDLLVHILAKNARYEVANYPNITIPTNLDVEDAAREDFGAFYVSLFDHTLAEHPNAVVTEYAWGATNCDPCPGLDAALTAAELLELGADVIGDLPPGTMPSPDVRPAKASVGGGLDKDIVRRIVRAHINEVRSCYAAGLLLNHKLSGRMDMRWIIGATGKVLSSEVGESTLGDEALGKCVTKAVKRWTFPKPKGGDEVSVEYPFIMSPGAPRRGGFGSGGYGGTVSPFVLTRLHARYDASSLGEDLVFEVAQPIAGGRERIGEDDQLERGAAPTMTNNFQARYAIRHAWTGKLACENPVRNIWGGPWPELEREAGPVVAKQLARVARGASLANFVSPKAAAQLGIEAGDRTEAGSKADAATPEPPAKAAPSESPTKPGCACSSAAGGEGPLAGLLGLFGLAGLGARRRRPMSP